MSREEAIMHLEYLKDFKTSDQIEALDVAIEALKQEKQELKQESVLDKVKAEIENITDTVETNPQRVWDGKLYVRYSDGKLYVRYSEVLNIIDKYKAESEVKE